MDAPEFRENVVRSGDRPLTLVGPELKVGDKAPPFQAVDGDFRPVDSSEFAGKALLIATVPSLDTSVCQEETILFNKEAERLPDDAEVLVISQDLPFAQTRFAAQEHITRVRILSDHVSRSFGYDWGVYIDEMGLLARSLWVVDRQGKISWSQVVPELNDRPDIDGALAALREAARRK